MPETCVITYNPIGSSQPMFAIVTESTPHTYNITFTCNPEQATVFNNPNSAGRGLSMLRSQFDILHIPPQTDS